MLSNINYNKILKASSAQFSIFRYGIVTLLCELYTELIKKETGPPVRNLIDVF